MLEWPLDGAENAWRRRKILDPAFWMGLAEFRVIGDLLDECHAGDGQVLLNERDAKELEACHAGG